MRRSNMRKILGIGIIGLIVIVFGLYNIKNNFASTDEWIYYTNAVTNGEYDNDGNEIQRGLCRIHRKTGKQELVWNGGYCTYIVTDQAVYIEDNATGIFQIDPDGSHLKQIYNGETNTYDLKYEDGWLYFLRSDACLRLHTETGELEELIKGVSTATNLWYGSLVVKDHVLYVIVKEGDEYRLLSYCLDGDEKGQYGEFPVKRLDDKQGNDWNLNLTECGEYLILNYIKNDELLKIYAVKASGQRAEDVEWQEVRFPDMKKESAEPPNRAGWYLISHYYGYVFHDGYVYYPNADWNLCSRPLFGETEDVKVYLGTAPALDRYGRACSSACDLGFGEEFFYYRYYTEATAGDRLYEAMPSNWDGYVGKLP